MFREMRRNKQELSMKDSLKIIKDSNTGVLALLGDDQYPYTIPINYVYHDNSIYFHSATSGHKIDAITKHNKASFCIVDLDTVVPDKLTSYFRSVIIFGRVEIVADDEKKKALKALSIKYAPNNLDFIDEEITKLLNVTSVIKFNIEHISGKQAIELVNQQL